MRHTLRSSSLCPDHLIVLDDAAALLLQGVHGEVRGANLLGDATGLALLHVRVPQKKGTARSNRNMHGRRQTVQPSAAESVHTASARRAALALRRPDLVEQLGLARVDVAHDADDRGAEAFLVAVLVRRLLLT